MEKAESEKYINGIDPYLIEKNNVIYKNNNSSQNEENHVMPKHKLTIII